MKIFMLPLAGSYRFTERRDTCQSPSNPPRVDLNIVIIWMITKVTRPTIVKGKTSHPLMRQSLSAVWSGSDLTIPQGPTDYIGLARGLRSIINTESCQSLSFTPRQCKTCLPCLDLLCHSFIETATARAGKKTLWGKRLLQLWPREETKRRQGGEETKALYETGRAWKVHNTYTK